MSQADFLNFIPGAFAHSSDKNNVDQDRWQWHPILIGVAFERAVV
jgi:hypothetical protein